MTKRTFMRHAAVAVSAALFAFSIGMLYNSLSAHADVSPGTLVGEGGDTVSPILQSLLQDDSAQLSPEVGTYSNVDIDQAIQDFIGTGPGTFAADFVVSERPLTSSETSTATTDGRSFSYVPFAASPVALLTLVPNSTWSGTKITASQFCQNIPLTLTQLDGIYGTISPPYTGWADPRLTSAPSCSATAEPISKYGNLDPTMENEAFMNYLDCK
jgi:ABC-type phosphate transport system substrate-binding protein